MRVKVLYEKLGLLRYWMTCNEFQTSNKFIVIKVLLKCISEETYFSEIFVVWELTLFDMDKYIKLSDIIRVNLVYKFYI